MLSTKTLATLFFIILNMQLAASSGTQETNSSGASTLVVKKSKSKPTSKSVLKDETDTTEAVQAVEGSTEEVVQAREPSVPQVNKKFEELFKQGKYDEIFAFGEKMKMKPDERMKQLCPAVKTHDQYNKIVEYLKEHEMVALFYVHGDIGVVRSAILANPSIYDKYGYVKRGDLEAALSFTLNNDCHDRVISFFKIRQEVTAKEDRPLKQNGYMTSFEGFVSDFLDDLAPWEDDMALRRFLAHCEEELRIKHSDLLDVLCKMLVLHLRFRLDKPKAVSLLIDLVGQPSLLTPVSFTKGFLCMAYDKDRLAFIQYGWAEAFQEGLKEDYPCGGEKLWQAMKERGRVQLTEKFPETEEERAVACKRFPTKKQKEQEKIMTVVAMICSEIGNHKSNFIILPTALWSIVSDYAFSLAEIDSTVSRSELISSNSV